MIKSRKSLNFVADKVIKDLVIDTNKAVLGLAGS